MFEPPRHWHSRYLRGVLGGEPGHEGFSRHLRKLKKEPWALPGPFTPGTLKVCDDFDYTYKMLGERVDLP